MTILCALTAGLLVRGEISAISTAATARTVGFALMRDIGSHATTYSPPSADDLIANSNANYWLVRVSPSFLRGFDGFIERVPCLVLRKSDASLVLFRIANESSYAEISRRFGFFLDRSGALNAIRKSSAGLGN